MREPQVTLVIVPRERFSVTERSLKNVYEYTTYPFELVYVSGGTTNRFKSYLENESRRRHFKFIHTDRYLSPNQARNLCFAARERANTSFSWKTTFWSRRAGWKRSLAAPRRRAPGSWGHSIF